MESQNKFLRLRKALLEVQAAFDSVVLHLEEQIPKLEREREEDMDIKAAAKCLNLSPRTMKSLEYRRELIPTRRGRRVVYTKWQIEDYRARLESEATAGRRRR